MKFSKWRIALIAIPTLISTAEWAIRAFGTFAYQKHWNIYYALPTFSSAAYLFVNPIGCPCDYGEMSYQPLWVISFFCFESVLTTVLFWGLVTWPIEFILTKRRFQQEGDPGDGRGSAFELVLLLGAIAFLTGLSIFLIKLFPGK